MLLNDEMLEVEDHLSGGIFKYNETYGNLDYYIPYRMLDRVLIADKFIEFVLHNETSYVVEVDDPQERYQLIGCLAEMQVFSIHFINDYEGDYVLMYGKSLFLTKNYFIVYDRGHGEVYNSISFAEIECVERDKATSGLFVKLKDSVGKSYYTKDLLYRAEVGCGYLWTFLDCEEVDEVVQYIKEAMNQY
jgi:hypothetical protein